MIERVLEGKYIALPADEPGAAFAHGAEADDQKFHTNNPFCVSVAAPRSGQRPAGAGSKAGTGPT